MNLDRLPPNLPKPKDDGACDHLLRKALPDVLLKSTSGNYVNPYKIKGCVVIYCYPMTGQPGKDLPEGWDFIPGARGCTPQSCSFRDYYTELQKFGVAVFGLSTQNYEDQKEVKLRLHLPFDLLSDVSLKFQKGLDLPVFKIDSRYFIRRLTMIAEDGKVIKYFYPVFPPDKHIEDVLTWLSSRNSFQL